MTAMTPRSALVITLQSHPDIHRSASSLETETRIPARCSRCAEQRVQPNFFFVLARFFLRIDGVMVRVIDTRYYHEFGSPYLVRERSRRESEYDVLARKVPHHVIRDADQVASRVEVREQVTETLALSG